MVLLRASFGARLPVLGTREHSAAPGVFGGTTVSSCIDNTPAPLMSTIEELGAFLAREKAAASTWPAPRDAAPAPVLAPAGVTQVA